MKKISLLFFCVSFISCELKKDIDKIGEKIQTYFPESNLILVSGTLSKKVEVLVKDEDYIFEPNYLLEKSRLICFLIKKEIPNCQVLSIKQIKGKDNILQDTIFQRSNLLQNAQIFEQNPEYLEMCKIIFKNFDTNQLWNITEGLRTFRQMKIYEDEGFNNFFKMLEKYSNECSKNSEEKKFTKLLGRGLLLVNSAGMRNFWKRDEKIDSGELIKNMNKIFKICGDKQYSISDQLKIENGEIID